LSLANQWFFVSACNCCCLSWHADCSICEQPAIMPGKREDFIMFNTKQDLIRQIFDWLNVDYMSAADMRHLKKNLKRVTIHSLRLILEGFSKRFH